MSVIFLLILVSLFVAICFLLAFFWAIRSGQFDDDYSPAVRVLFDDGVSAPDSGKENHTDQSLVPNSEKNQ